MKTIFFNTIFLLFIFIVSSSDTMHAQVTVGLGEAPVKHALLQIKDKRHIEGGDYGGITATSGGLVLPRVELVKRTELQPFVADLNDPDYMRLKLEHTGLIVYNLKDIPLERLSKGLNIWNGKEWKTLSESLGKAEFDYCTESIEVKGNYVHGQELTTSNYLKIKVKVSIPGTYEIVGATNNGYFFTASGQFLTPGIYTILAQGQGTPIAVGTNIVTMTNNGDEILCQNSVVVNVLSSVANFSLDCIGTNVNGIYTLATNLDLSNTITMKVNVKTSGSWEISSPMVDGVSFYGSGSFGSSELGVRVVTLYGNGKPTKGGSIDIPLYSNSIGGVNMDCSAKIMISIPPKRVLGISAAGFYSLGPTSAGYTLLKNNKNFGTNSDSRVKIQNIEVANVEIGYFLRTTLVPGFGNRSISDLLSGSNPVDVVFIGFDSRPADISTTTLLVNYVKKGGVLIWADENSELSEHTGGGTRNFFKMLYDDLSITTNTEAVLELPGGALYKLPFNDDLILNGPFGDIRGRFIGEDAGYTDGFPISGPMSNLVEWYYNGYNHSNNATKAANHMIGFKAKDYSLVWFGDGGIFAGNSTDTSKTIYPAQVKGNEPTDKEYGNASNTRKVVNSTLFCNLMTWALLKAEESGINSK